jgi:hypothetical protein
LLFSVVSKLLTRTDNVAGSLLWVGLGVLPVCMVAVWSVRQRPDHTQARRLLLVASSIAVGVAIEQVVQPDWLTWAANNRRVWVNLIYAITGVLTLIGAALLFATYPDGDVEHRWQRKVVRGTWWLLAGPVLHLFTSSTVPIDKYMRSPPPVIPNPLAVPSLAALNPLLLRCSFSAITRPRRHTGTACEWLSQECTPAVMACR